MNCVQKFGGEMIIRKAEKEFGLCGAFNCAVRVSNPDVQFDNICNVGQLYLFTVYLMMLAITLTVQN
jgi:hypothetical protein